MIESLLKISHHLKEHNDQRIGNTIILFSCQLTVLILLTACAFVSGQQYFGEPIKCVQNLESIPDNLINSFCFISFTFSRLEPEDITDNFNSTIGHLDKPMEHSYYPWVPVVTFLQGLSFLFPHVIWSMNDNSYLEWCLMESKTSLKQNYMIPMAKYISKRLHNFDGLMLVYLASEVMYAVIVHANFALTDMFLGGNFFDYGYKVFYHGLGYGDTIFPKMIKCTFYKYGPSGTMENIDALCVLPLNMLNEFLYLVLWFWFLLLMALSVFILLRRIVYFLIFVFRHRCPLCIRVTFAGDISCNSFGVLISKLSLSDWLLLEHIKSNMDKKLYIKQLENIAREISEPHDLILSGTKLI